MNFILSDALTLNINHFLLLNSFSKNTGVIEFNAKMSDKAKFVVMWFIEIS